MSGEAPAVRYWFRLTIHQPQADMLRYNKDTRLGTISDLELSLFFTTFERDRDRERMREKGPYSDIRFAGGGTGNPRAKRSEICLQLTVTSDCRNI